MKNRHIDQNLTKLFPKISKRANFALESSIFSKLLAPLAPKIWSFKSLWNPILWSWDFPFRPSSPDFPDIPDFRQKEQIRLPPVNSIW